MKFSSILATILLVAVQTGCASLNNQAQNLVDRGARYSAERNVGKPYATLAKQRDLTLERKPILGRPVGVQDLPNGQKIYFHQARQVSPSSANLANIVSFGDKEVRYDDYAYLVSPSGKILDYAHKRSNSKYRHVEFESGFLATAFEGEEVNNQDIVQLRNFVTSSGNDISSWYKNALG